MLKLGSRSSQLATWQANHIQAKLRELGVEVEIVFISTEGDQSQQSLKEFGGQGAFTKSIQQALLSKKIDFAVHSLKDLPTEKTEGLMLGAVPERENNQDVLVASKYADLNELPAEAVIGTGSIRRQAQVLHHRSDLKVNDIRGNVETRIRKMESGEYDAIVLAKAGLVRLGLADHISAVFDREFMLPAIGQGALGLECRDGDEETASQLQKINDETALAEVTAERALLRSLRAGCLAPVGAYCEQEDEELLLHAVVLSQDGVKRIAASLSGPGEKAEQIGIDLAQQLVDQGAAELLAR